MKPSADTLHFLTPESAGWAVWRGVQRLGFAATLAEAADLLPAACRFEFALPSHPLILERLRLPTTEREDLAGMVHLQWEKALPFSPEEITGAFLVLESGGDETLVWSAAASRDALQEFGADFKKGSHWPHRVTPWVCHVAAACPKDETVLVVYAEQGHWVVVVVEKQRPGWVHVLSSADAASFAAEFSSLMLTAGLDGVPNAFSRILLSPEVDGAEAVLRSAVRAPIEPLPLVTPVSPEGMNLLSSEWLAAARQNRNSKVWKRRALVAAGVYLFLAALAGVDLLLLHHRTSGLEAELDAQRPTLAVLQGRQARYNSLAAAIDSRRYAVELLFLLQRCLPAESVHFTEFEQMPEQWRVVGEAPNAGLAIDYLARLKHDPDLSASDISSDPPRLLAGDRAQFQVIGKP
jgi:hypothetical protein